MAVAQAALPGALLVLGTLHKAIHPLLTTSPAATPEAAALVQLHSENASKYEHIFYRETLLPPPILGRNAFPSLQSQIHHY